MNDNEQPQVAERVQGYREYTYNGSTMPSVSSVLGVGKDENLMRWHAKTAVEHALNGVTEKRTGSTRMFQSWGISPKDIKAVVSISSDEPARVRDKAAAVGSRVHELIAEGRRPDDTDEQSVRNAYKSYEMWLKDIGGFAFVEQERPVVRCSRNGFWYAGTPDAVIDVGQRRILIDWKVTSRIRDSHALQAAAYAHAWNSSHNLKRAGRPVTDAWVVRLSKTTPQYEYREVDIERAYKIFEKYLYIHQTAGSCWKTTSK